MAKIYLTLSRFLPLIQLFVYDDGAGGKYDELVLFFALPFPPELSEIAAHGATSLSSARDLCGTSVFAGDLILRGGCLFGKT